MSPQGNRWYWFVVFLVRQIYLRLLTGGMKVVGLENVPREGPVILAPIHVSNFDPPVVSCASPRAVNFMAKEELFSPKWMGKLITSLGAFPVKRGAGDTSAVKIAIERLQEGCTLILFPEGTRGEPEQTSRLKKGIYHLVKDRMDTKITPVVTHGLGRTLPRGEALFVPFNCDVVIGDKLPHTDSSNELLGLLSANFKNLLKDCLTYNQV